MFEFNIGDYTIMNTPVYDANRLRDLLRRQRIATFPELESTLGCRGRMTVIRKLEELSYLSSYSHGGRYYTLKGTPVFDAYGLWEHDGVWFSRFGTLLSTAQTFVDQSEAGYYVSELDTLLHVDTRKAVKQLVDTQQLHRERAGSCFLYCSCDSRKRIDQLHARGILSSEFMVGSGLRLPKASMDEIKAATILFLSMLDEKQRRLYAGLQSLKWGHGGDRSMGQALGIDEETVARGRRELEDRDVEIDGIRRSGAGRPKKKRMS